MGLDDQQIRHGLTVLTRLAQREPPVERVIAGMLEHDLDRLAVPAATVAGETGEPLGRLLAAALNQSAASQGTLRELHRLSRSGALVPPEVVAVVAGHLYERVDRKEAVQRGSLQLQRAAALTALDRTDEALASTDLAEQAAEQAGQYQGLLLLETRNAQASAHEAAGRLDQALAASDDALRLAQRHLSGEHDPRLGDVLVRRGFLQRRTARFAEAVATFRRAVVVWRHLLPQADLGTELMQDRIEQMRGGSVHLVVGEPGADLWGGPRFGDYRINTVIDKEGTWLLNQLSPWLPPWSLAYSSLWLGECLLLSGQLHDGCRILDDLVRDLASPGRAEEPYASRVLQDALLNSAIGTYLLERHGGQALRTLARIPPDSAERCSALADAALQHVATAASAHRWTEHVEHYIAAVAGLATAHARSDPRLSAALLSAGVERAIQLKNTGHEIESISLLEQLSAMADTLTTIDSPSTASLTSLFNTLANARIRTGQHDQAVTAARRAVAIAGPSAADLSPVMVSMAWHTLSRSLHAEDQRAEAADAESHAIEAILPNLANPAPDVLLLAINQLATYARLTSGPNGRADLPPHVLTAARLLLDTEAPLAPNATDELAMVGFCALSAAARSRDPDSTHRLHQAFLGFADRHCDVEAIRIARALVGWNVLMCYVDTGYDENAMTAVLDDNADLARRFGNSNAFFVTEHAKCATELIQVHLTANNTARARALTRAAESSLRSPHYLAARQLDLGEDPRRFLATLDALLLEPTPHKP